MEKSKINKNEFRREVTPEMLFERLRESKDTAMIFLKGGQAGGLEPDLKKKIFVLLGQWFDIYEGEAKMQGFKEIAVRWGGSGLIYQFNKMRRDPRFTPEFINIGEKLMADQSADGFSAWLARAKEIAADDPGLIRQIMMLDYLGAEGEALMIRLKPGMGSPERLS